MSSFLARRLPSVLRLNSVPHGRIATRQISVTASVGKQKQKKYEAEEIDFSDDLFVDPEAPKAAAKPSTSSSPAKTQAQRKAHAETRATNFTEQLQFVAARVGKNPTEKIPLVRKATWVGLLQLATTEAQVQQVVDLLPAWMQTGRGVRDNFALELAQRCDDLRCPTIALEVFGNFAKYKLALTQASGQSLLHSLRHDLENLAVAAALFEAYGLKPVAEDLVSASIFSATCLKDGSPESTAVADGLLPSIKTLLQDNTLFQATDAQTRKKAKWVLGSLRTINQSWTERQGAPFIPLDGLSLAPLAPSPSQSAS